MDPRTVLTSLCLVAGLPPLAWQTISARDYLAAVRRRFSS